MHFLDYLVVVAYLGLMLGLGVFFGRNQSRREFFAAGNSMGWLPVGLSVMATLFSSNSFVFYPAAALGDSLRIGLSLVAFALMTPIVVMVFIPVYTRLKVETAYQYLELRFHVSVRILASGLFVLLRIGWMASATYAASVVVSSVMGVSQIAVIVGLGIVSVGYTMVGGLRAVMWTDVIQFFVFVTTILVTLGLIVQLTDASVMEIFHTYFDGREGLVLDFTPSMTLPYGSWVILIGVFLEGLSAFGADQVAVQRYISSRSERSSQLGAVLNLFGLWIVIPGLMMIGVGLFAYFTEHSSELGTGTLTEILAGDSKVADRALPDFVRVHFPAGLAGLFLAALMAAIMSSIDSGVHSVTTAVVVDFRDRLFPHLRPDNERAEIRWIRTLVVIIGAITITLACFVGPLGNVFDICKMLTAAFGGPLLAIFILAFFSKRATWLAVLLSVSISTIFTLALMCTQDWFSIWYWPIGFGTAMVLGWLASYLQAAEPTEYTFFQIMKHQDGDV
ncbi:solute:Na+ symporter, SSS family [Neorhodopirellula lusitana]|uniref:Solute:Na+ symporter, SSS family n=1 Tax=Neorhodopirellula lusitana TaxID=445327 RepID=A0ABY1QIH8_9BACT|nr:sodium/solute symporter [Neorhodopirellula lusitana]SMP72341.1 solute:Na+ symporter, SSS family [Neorhodopirellula lusitana]